MASLNSLVEVDSIEFAVIVDNEVDPISPVVHPGVQYKGRLPEVKLSPIPPGQGRGGALAEIPMHAICCGAHGLSLSIVCRFSSQSFPTIGSLTMHRSRLPSRAMFGIHCSLTRVPQRTHLRPMLRGFRSTWRWLSASTFPIGTVIIQVGCSAPSA